MNNQTYYEELKSQVQGRWEWNIEEKPITNGNDLRKLLESIRRSNRRIDTEYVVPVPNKKNRDVVFVIKDTGFGGYGSMIVGTSLVIDAKNTNRKEIVQCLLIEKNQKKIPVRLIDDIVKYFEEEVFLTNPKKENDYGNRI